MLEHIINNEKGLKLLCELESRSNKCSYSTEYEKDKKYCKIIRITGNNICKYQGPFDINYNSYRCQK